MAILQRAMLMFSTQEALVQFPTVPGAFPGQYARNSPGALLGCPNLFPPHPSKSSRALVHINILSYSLGLWSYRSLLPWWHSIIIQHFSLLTFNSSGFMWAKLLPNLDLCTLLFSVLTIYYHDIHSIRSYYSLSYFTIF